MKRKELYQFVREGIIEELSLNEDAATDAAAAAAAKANQTAQITSADAQIKYADAKEKAAQAALKAAQALKQQATKEKTKTSSDQKPELEEMARIPNKIRLGDVAKIALAKELYGTETIEGRLIAAIEGSEDGLTQKELETALGGKLKLNTFIEKLVSARVLTKPVKAATEPETTVEPEENLPTLDTDEEPEIETPADQYLKPDEEESVPEEPKSKEEIEKDKIAQELSSLSDEEKIKFNKYLTSVNKNKKDKPKVEAILALARTKFSPEVMNLLYQASGRDIKPIQNKNTK